MQRFLGQCSALFAQSVEKLHLYGKKKTNLSIMFTDCTCRPSQGTNTASGLQDYNAPLSGIPRSDIQIQEISSCKFISRY